jgi:hypothetical protein
MIDRRSVAGAAAVVVLLILCYLVVGLEVVPVAIIGGFAVYGWRRDPGLPFALAAWVLLVVAAIATVVPAYPSMDGWSMTFSSDRGLAAEAARIAGLLFALASVLMAAVDRSAWPAPHRRWIDPRTLHRWSRRRLWSVTTAIEALFVSGMLLGGAVIRMVMAPAPLAPAYDGLVTNLRLGTHYALDSVTNAGPIAAIPPLSPLTIAYMPIAPQELAVIAGIAAMGLSGWLAGRIRGMTAGGAALVIAVILPSMWDTSLAVVLAGACLLVAVALLDGRRTSPARALWAGAALGLAILARTEVVLVVPLILAWSRDRGMPGLRVLVTGIAALLTTAPWWVFVHDRTGSLLPTPTIASFLNDPLGIGHSRSASGWIGGVLAIGVAIALTRGTRLWRQWWVLWAVPGVALLLALTDLPSRDPLSWSAPMLVSLIGAGVAERLHDDHQAFGVPSPRRAGSMVGPLPTRGSSGTRR